MIFLERRELLDKFRRGDKDALLETYRYYVRDVSRFLTRGCTAAIAASSALTEWMTGKDRTELAALAPAVIEAAVGGLEPASKHAAVLCVDAVRQLLAAAPKN